MSANTSVTLWRQYNVETKSWKFEWSPTIPYSDSPFPYLPFETVSSRSVIVEEESTPIGFPATKGRMAVETKRCRCSSGTTHHDMQWPYPISAMAFMFHTTTIMEGDSVIVSVGPDTDIGIRVQNDLKIGDTYVDLNNVTGLSVGLYVKVAGVDLGYIEEVNTTDNRIRIPAVLQDIQAANSSLTFELRPVRHLEFGGGTSYQIGQSKIGGSYVPANTTVRITYENTHANDVIFRPTIEFLY